jgi:3-hydroxymyristoyl/3-hydroxydecanoyl-(acyl carrier protein) dehydratase
VINPEVELKSCEIATLPSGLEFVGTWQVPRDLRYFEGHFPGFPVLPAVAILDFSVEIIRRAKRVDQLELMEVRNAKFSHPIQPEMKIEIRVTQSEADWKVRWLGGELLADLSLRVQ